MLKATTSIINASQIATPITLPGNVTLSTGNLIIGTAGKGIDFSATAGSGTSELLADYEEGTWTPAVRGSSTAGTYELATATGTYTKVGNLVTVSCFIAAAASVTGGGAGYLQITGFPFANGAGATGAVRLAGVVMTALYTWVVAAPISNSGTTTWYIEESGSAQNGSDLPISGFGVNDQIKITVTYRT
jgi:hypothetical protein